MANADLKTGSVSPGSSPMETDGRYQGNELSNLIRISNKFAAMNKLILRDLNKANTAISSKRYSKDDVKKYLESPARYEKELRKVITYIYGASTHFSRLVQYFVGLSDLSYIIEPTGITPSKAKPKTIENNYRKTLKTVEAFNFRSQLPSILTVCLREDVFYGTLWVSDESIIIQRLPSDYCQISTIEGNVPNVTFDFSYFDADQSKLDFFPPEFTKKYNQYKANRTAKKIELDQPTSFAIKANSDILEYPLPPFAGLLCDLYTIEDYKQLKETKTSLDNYAMLAMTLPMDKDGGYLLNFNTAKEFWGNLDSVLPDEVGSVLTPMKIEKIGFERSSMGDRDIVAEAEQHMFTNAGVQSLLFNNDKASANALTLSIKADQAITYGIVKKIQDAVNRFLLSLSYGKNFKVNFLDVSPFNRKEVGDAYLKAASYGLPTISAYAASQGIGQAELDAMSFLEGTVLNLPSMFKPIQSSSQLSSSDLESNAATDEGGAPRKEAGELSDKRESNQESE